MADFTSRIIHKLGLDVLSEVTPRGTVASGARVFLVKSSCAETVETGTLTAPPAGSYSPEQLEHDIEAFRDRLAEDCARKKLGLKPPPQSYTSIRVAPLDRDHWSSNLVALVDWQRPTTAIQRAVAEVLNLTAKEDGACKVRIEIAGRVIRADVLAIDMPTPCVIGRDLVREISGDVYHLFEETVDRFGKALRDVAKAKKQTVLVIGKYGENTERLRQVQALASIKGYHAILLKDYEDIQELSLPEKALLFGLLSCFVICDDTVASGHNEELPILANAGFVIAILCPTTGCSSWMHAHFPTSFRNVRVFEYSSDISARIQEAILWAEQQAQQVTRDWNELYPWRQATFPRGTD